MHTWRFWAELLARSSLLLLVAQAARRSLRAHSAALRHKLLLAAFVLLALLPALAILLPEIPIVIPVSPRQKGAVVLVEQQPGTALVDLVHRRTDWLLLLWIFGALAALLPVAAGAISVNNVVRRARPFGRAFGTRNVTTLVSDEVAAPITCGFLRPKVILPASAEDWSHGRMEAVLFHELAHVRRRDVAAQLAAHLIAALWWFQPLVWILRRALRSESELACDAEALQSGMRPSNYAAELLAVARSIRAGSYAISTCGLDMAAGSNLQHRVEMILQTRTTATPLPGRIALAAILGAAAIAASSFTLNSGPSFSEQGGSTMKRTLISGLLTTAGLTAATISGSVHDSGGNAIPNATVTVLNPDTGAKQDAVTNSEGKFSLSGDGAGQYLLKVEKQGFAPVLRVFDLKAESNMERELTMSPEGSPSQAADLVTDTNDSTKPVNVGGAVAESNLIKKVQPVYPASAKASATQGTVQIKTAISKDGVPVDLQVVSTPSSDLAESALEAVRQWRYRPTLLNGEPVEVATTITINYSLSE